MKKTKHCLGCGIKLQDDNILNIGYTTNIENELCMRCFKLKNYGEYESISSNLVEYDNILTSINRTRDLVLFVVDTLNLPRDLLTIRKYLKNKVILVLNKRDLIPLSVKDEKLINYIKDNYPDFEYIVPISTEKNLNMDRLYNLILKNKTSNNIYVVGYTNAGKSSLITKLVKNYSENECNLTISPLPSTTLSKIEVKINDKLNIIDTPGIIDNTNMINFVDQKLYKKLNSKKEIKPRTYQLYKNQSLIINDSIRIDYKQGDKNSFTFFIPNEIKIKRVSRYSDKLRNQMFIEKQVKFNEDLVINGLGFIKIVSSCTINVYLDKDICIFMRKSMI